MDRSQGMRSPVVTFRALSLAIVGSPLSGTAHVGRSSFTEKTKEDFGNALICVNSPKLGDILTRFAKASNKDIKDMNDIQRPEPVRSTAKARIMATAYGLGIQQTQDKTFRDQIRRVKQEIYNQIYRDLGGSGELPNRIFKK